MLAGHEECAGEVWSKGVNRRGVTRTNPSGWSIDHEPIQENKQNSGNFKKT